MSVFELGLLPFLLALFAAVFVALVRLAVRPTNRRLDHLIDLLERQGPMSQASSGGTFTQPGQSGTGTPTP